MEYHIESIIDIKRCIDSNSPMVAGGWQVMATDEEWRQLMVDKEVIDSTCAFKQWGIYTPSCQNDFNLRKGKVHGSLISSQHIILGCTQATCQMFLIHVTT